MMNFNLKNVIASVLILAPVFTFGQSVQDGSFESANMPFGTCGLSGNQLQTNYLNGNTDEFASSGAGSVCMTDGGQAFYYSADNCPGQAPDPTNGSFCVGLGNNAVFAQKLSADLLPGLCYTITFDVRNRSHSVDGSAPGDNTCNYPAKLQFGFSNNPLSFGTSAIAQTNDVAPSDNWALAQTATFLMPAGATGNNYITFQLANQADVNAFLYVDNVTIVSVPCSILPLHLISFKALSSGNGNALLEWVTVDEKNTAAFEIESSSDAVTFVRIASVKANNSPLSQVYHASVPVSAEMKTFLRLKMKDKDGAYTYSKIIEINSDSPANDAFVIVPNPSRDLIKIPADINNVVIYNLSGSKISTPQIKNGFADISKINAGTYFLELYNKTGVKIVKRLVITK